MKRINTEKEYEAALLRLEKLIDSKPNTPNGIEAEKLSELIAAYEEENYMTQFDDESE